MKPDLSAACSADHHDICIAGLWCKCECHAPAPTSEPPRPDEAVNYWDLIARNNALTERLLAILGPPINNTPTPRLIGGYTIMASFQARNVTYERVTIDMRTTPNGDGIEYTVKNTDGYPLHRGIWSLNAVDAPDRPFRV